MALSEKVIQYAVREFETAIRAMSANSSPAHTFRLSDDPPLSILLQILPTSVAEVAMDRLDEMVRRTLEEAARRPVN